MRRAAVAAACAAGAVAVVAGLALFTEAIHDPGAAGTEPPRTVAPDGGAPPPPSPLGERAALLTEAECAAEGGEWQWTNAFFKSCVLAYPDAGKACSSSFECAGGCFAHDFGSLEAGTGTCRATTDRSGCMGEIGGTVIECLYDDIMVLCTRDSAERECEALR